MVAFDGWHHDRMTDRSYGGGMMDGGASWVVPVLLFLLLAMVVGAAVYALVTTTAPATPEASVAPNVPSSSREVLDLRLAHGEITPEEYGARRQLLDH